VEGRLLGNGVGFKNIVGLEVGIEEGLDVGREVGIMEGCGVGRMVMVGLEVG
jgi:UDP-3-O-[3-hydroxymyristoyl] glucosamine N-acyltransferase